MLFGLVAGCGTDNNSPSTPPSNAVDTPKPSDNGADTEDPDAYVYRMPIAEGEEITIWRGWESTYLTDPNEALANIELEKRTGVKAVYNCVSTASQGEQFNLLIASQVYPDLIFASSFKSFIGGIDKAIEDDVVLRINEYIDKWAPEYKARMDGDIEVYRQSVTDAGNMAGFTCIQEGEESAWLGPVTRYDWLADMGKTANDIVTYDDWHEMLTYYKDVKNAIQPLQMTATGFENTGYSFGVCSTFYNENGTVKHGVLDVSFKDYIARMNQWFSEGLIHRDFTTNTAWYMSTPNVLNGEIGVLVSISNFIANMNFASEDPAFNVGAIPIPVVNRGDVGHFRRVNFVVGDHFVAVTPTAQSSDSHLETVIRWMDYRYSEEGSLLLMYGIEGTSYNIGSDGKPVFSDLVLHDAEGLAPADAMTLYAESSGHGVYYRWIRNWGFFDNTMLENFEIWDRADGAYVMPNTTLTSAEGDAFSAKYQDIDTLIQERLPRFIIGEIPMSDWDAFISQIESMGIAECISYQQTALDRYFQR